MILASCTRAVLTYPICEHEQAFSQTVNLPAIWDGGISEWRLMTSLWCTSRLQRELESCQDDTLEGVCSALKVELEELQRGQWQREIQEKYRQRQQQHLIQQQQQQQQQQQRQQTRGQKTFASSHPGSQSNEDSQVGKGYYRLKLIL